MAGEDAPRRGGGRLKLKGGDERKKKRKREAQEEEDEEINDAKRRALVRNFEDVRASTFQNFGTKPKFLRGQQQLELMDETETVEGEEPGVDAKKLPPRARKSAEKGEEVDEISIYGDLRVARKKIVDTRSDYEKMLDRRSGIKADRMCNGVVAG